MQKITFISGVGAVLVLAPVALVQSVNAREAFASAPSWAARQSAAQATPSSSNSHIPDYGQKEENAAHEHFEEQAAKARNTERFKRIQTDTEKLLQLSTELKADVDKSTKNEMSLDVIRKAAEVERLAHDVKERMKG